jgi:hypothetical protein
MFAIHAVIRSSSLYYGTVLDVVHFATTSTADVTFGWFATARITNGIPSWAIASKMTLLPNMMLDTTGIRSNLSDVAAGPTYIVFRWLRTLWTGVDEVLMVL